MLTGPLLIVTFVISIVFLLVTIIKFNMNAFVSLLLTSVLTALLVQMPVEDISSTITAGFSSTVGGIGIVTGLGVMLGMFLFESGGIISIANAIIRKFGVKKSPIALALSAFVAGIPVFGDIVDILFAPMVRTLSYKTGIARMTFVAAVAVSGSIAASAIIPTPPPLAVSEILGLNIGVFFVYSVFVSCFGMLFGGILWGVYLDKQEKKVGTQRVLEAADREELAALEENNENGISFGKSISMIVLPIIIIVVCSFSSSAFTEGSTVRIWLNFIGDKNIAMLIGVFYAVLVSKPYLKKSASDVMIEAADQVGLVLLITGAGGSFGEIIQATGIGDYLAQVFSIFNIPILLMCFVLSQLIRCAQGSTTVALMTTASIMASTIASSSVSPVLSAIAICAGGVGLSLPNDSGFWSIGRFNRITIPETFKAWTTGGFIAGFTMFLVTCVLSLFQSVLPGL